MKPSRLEIQRVEASKTLAESVAALVERLDRIEAKLDALATGLAKAEMPKVKPAAKAEMPKAKADKSEKGEG